MTVSQKDKWREIELHRRPINSMVHKWQRWSSAHSVIVAYQKHFSILSFSPSTSLSAHSAALNGSVCVCELCRGGMQKTGLEPICLGRFKGNFYYLLASWTHFLRGLCFHYLKWSVKSPSIHKSCDISRCRTWACVLLCPTSYSENVMGSRKIRNVGSLASMHRLAFIFFYDISVFTSQ